MEKKNTVCRICRIPIKTNNKDFPEIRKTLTVQFSSVADTDPADRHVFGPTGSGSGSFYHEAKIVRKNLDFYCFFFK